MTQNIYRIWRGLFREGSQFEDKNGEWRIALGRTARKHTVEMGSART
jgi:hypothetical protein